MKNIDLTEKSKPLSQKILMFGDIDLEKKINNRHKSSVFFLKDNEKVLESNKVFSCKKAL